MVGGWFYHRPHVCGGTDNLENYQECMEYEFDDDTWLNSSYHLGLPRVNADGTVLLSDYSFLVTGGDPDPALDTSEILVDNEEFVSGPELPASLVRHCSVAVNETHVLVTGGAEKVHMLDLVTDLVKGTWTSHFKDIIP